MQKIPTIPQIKSVVSTLGQKYNAERIYLFGSYARCQATPTSDIDLRIDPCHIHGYFALSDLHLHLQDQLGKKIDLVPSDALDPTFLNHIKSEEILLYDATVQR